MGAVLWGAALSAATSTSPVQICFQSFVDFPVPARAAFEQELAQLFPGSRLRAQKRLCDPLAPRSVWLTLKAGRKDVPSDVLGLAYRSNGRILPRLEIFLDPVKRVTRKRDWEGLGRALARVAGHELLHYLNQSASHDDGGLGSSHMAAIDLVRQDRRRLLLGYDWPRFDGVLRNLRPVQWSVR